MLSAANALIAVGLLIEYRCIRTAKVATEELQRQSDERVAAAEALGAEANQRAAEANQRAEEARLELAKYRAPRVLGVDRHKRIADGLRQFAGVKYVCGVSWVHPEFMTLVAHIEDVLEDAGWEQVECPSQGIKNPNIGRPYICTGAKNTGVKILINTSVVRPPAPAPELELIKDAGIALAASLTAEGIETILEVKIVAPVPGESATMMHVMIGPKR